MLMTPWLRSLRHSIHRTHFAQAQQTRIRRRKAAHDPQTEHLASQVELLEDRTLLSTITWTNRGTPGDEFDSTFGANAPAARAVVDAVLTSWQRAINDFNQPSGGNNIDIKISMNTGGTGFGAAASVTSFDNGFPTAGSIGIDRGSDITGDGIGDGAGFFLDPTPLDNSEFAGNIVHAFTGDAQPGSPAAGISDLFTLVNAEITHVMGLFLAPALIQNPMNGMVTDTGVPDDAEGGGIGTYFVFDGPNVTHLMTSNNGGGGGSDFMQLIHSAGPPNGPNQPLTFNSAFRGSRDLVGAQDPGNAVYEFGRRYLVNDVMALVFQDAYNYDIVSPQTFGTMYAILDETTGNLLIRGGVGGSDDVITITASGGNLDVSVDIGNDVPGSGPNGDDSPIAAFVSQFPLASVSTITIQSGDGFDTINLTPLGIPVDIDGGIPSPPTFPGDTLVFDAQGAIAVDSGSVIQTLGFADVNYVEIENVVLLNVGPNLPPVVSNQAFVIPESSPNGTVVGTVAASDPNTGDVLTFAITAGNTAGAFAINGTTGQITVSNNTPFQTVDRFFLTVQATDAGGLTDSATVAVLLQGGVGQVSSIFIEPTSELLVSAELDEPIEITVGGGFVFVNGSSPSTGSLPVASVRAITVGGGEGGNLIDLRGVTTADGFVNLFTIFVDGGEGPDTILTSPLGGTYQAGHDDDLVIGDIGDDIIFGEDGHDTILAGDGNDSLFGGNGNDLIDAEAGNDFVDGEDGQDSVDGGDGNDNLRGNNGTDTLNGNNGDDTLNGGAGVDRLNGGADNDRLLGGSSGDVIFGAAGNDTLKGQGGVDTLDGGDGNDLVDGGAEPDSLLGGNGNDNLKGRGGGDTLNGGDGNDNLNGGRDDDTLIGGVGDDTLRGGADNDSLFGDSSDPTVGGTGSDVLKGQGGQDTLNGGGGFDRLDGGSGDDLVQSGIFTTPPVELAIQNVRIDPEGDSGTRDATFTVTLSRSSVDTILVDFATADDTAIGGPDAFTPGADYVSTSGRLTFLPGMISQTLTVPIIGDTRDELVETFFVNLSNPFAAVIADNQARGRIIDDDETSPDVDIFLLFDDTGSFSGVAPALISAFPTVISNLQAQLPGSSLAYGIGRFEEYGGFASEGSDGRPFILNQPIIETGVPQFTQAIDAAMSLLREAPGFGGDVPETGIEALFQVATGVGFDGNDDGDTTDSGPAGLITTQITPGLSGDVPAFASFTPDPTPPPDGPVLPPSGNIGGVGFRPGTQRLVLLATDAGFAYEPDGIDPYTGIGGVTVPAADVQVDGRGSTPGGRGAQIQATVDALLAEQIQVIGLGGSTFFGGDGTDPTIAPRRPLEALSRLTGAINNTGTQVDGGIPADPIDPGDPFYFFIDVTSPTLPDDLAAAIVAAVGGSVQVGPTLSIDDVTIDPEGDAGTTDAVFTVTLSAIDANPVTVDFTTVGGSATAGADFTMTSGTATIPAGSTTATITVPVLGDRLDEFDENFFVALSNPVGATLDIDQAEGSIIDDDDPGDKTGDKLMGGAGNDTVIGSDGADTFLGGGGDDWIDGGNGNDLLQGFGGNDTLSGNTGDDTLLGGGAVDVLFGDLDPADPDFSPFIHNGRDVIVWNGGDGNDVIDGGLGFDDLQINTGRENDTLAVAADGTKLTVTASTVADPVGQTTRSQSIEKLTVRTNAGNDRVTVGDLFGIASMQLVEINGGGGGDVVDASLQANPILRISMSGGNGNDTLSGGAGGDFLRGDNGADSLSGGGGGDALAGGDGNDTLSGGDGHDRLDGEANRDVLRGDAGNDTLDGGTGNDRLFGDAGNDSLLGSLGNDSALGGTGDDTLDGSVGDDTLDGNDGDDVLRGDAGADSLLGGLGNDTLAGGDDGDHLNGGGGNDFLLGEQGDDHLNGNADEDTLSGGVGDDTLLGGSGADELFGGEDQDALNGNSGNDTLRGGQGPDMLRGGTGNDTLNGGDGADTMLGEAGNDALAGHDGNDILNGGGDGDTLIAGDGDDKLRGGSGTDYLVGGSGEDDLDGQGGVDTLSSGQGLDTVTGLADDVIDESIEDFFDPNKAEFNWINAV